MTDGIRHYYRVNQLAKAGYKLNTSLKWWFNELLKVAVHDHVIRNNYSKFLNNKLVGSALHGWVFFPPTEKTNRDILDTVYRLQFMKDTKFIPGDSQHE